MYISVWLAGSYIIMCTVYIRVAACCVLKTETNGFAKCTRDGFIMS